MHNNPVVVPLKVGYSGRYKAVVHDGSAIFDEVGNVIGGNVKCVDGVEQKTPFGKNKITLTGFAALLGSSDFRVICVVGDGNAAPSEENTVLQSYKGYGSTAASLTTVFNSTVVSGLVNRKITYRQTFNPGSLGAATVNVAEAGMAITAVVPTAGTPLLSRGLLVDGSGNPVTVAVAPTDFLDIVWELTEYVAAEVTGTFDIDINGTVISHAYTLRPAYFVTSPPFGWTVPAIQPDRFIYRGLTMTSGDTNWGRGSGMTNGALAALTGYPSNTYSGERRPQVFAPRAYVANSKQRLIDLTWVLTQGNAPGPGYSNIIAINVGSSNWQIEITPAIQKTASTQFDFVFSLQMANSA